MTTPRQLRQQVLDLRVRLELCAATAFDRCCAPTRRDVQRNIPTRLLYLVDAAPPARQEEVHRLARLAGHVYQQACGVLHGRVRALALSAVVVDEWRTVVAELEKELHP
jgi:hypothetical protein